MLGELNRTQGTTVLVVTHDPRVAQATQRIVRMHDGRIVEDHRLLDPIGGRPAACWRAANWGMAILNEDDMPLVNMTPGGGSGAAPGAGAHRRAGEEASAPADARVN